MKITKQTNSNDCGLYVIQALYEHFFHRPVTITTLRQQAALTSEGMTIASLVSLGQAHHLEIRSFRANAKDVLRQKNQKFIALFTGSINYHYVIIEIKHDYVDVWDPARGHYRLLFAEFMTRYQNIIMTVKHQPDTTHKVIRTKSRKLHNVWMLVADQPQLVLWAAITIMISLTLTFASGVFMKMIFDLVIMQMLPKLLTVLSIAFGAMALIRAVNNFVKKLLIKKITFYVEWKIFTQFNFALAHSKANDLAKFAYHDLFKKEILIEPLSVFIGSAIFVIFTDLIYLIVSIAILVWLSFSLFTFTIAFSVVLILFSLLFEKILLSLHDRIIKQDLKFLDRKQDLIHSVLDHKEIGKINFATKRLKTSFIANKKLDYKVWLINTYGLLLREVILFIFPIIVTYGAVKLIFRNDFSVGNFVFFLSVQNFFMLAINSLATFLLKWPQNRKYLKMVEEVLHIQPEQVNPRGLTLAPLQSIAIKNLSFGYNQPLLRISFWKITKSLQIFGKNGAGKSTFLKIIALHLQAQGTILFNDIKLPYLNLDQMRQRIFYVRPETPLLRTTLVANITWNDPKRHQQLRKNIKVFQLEQFLVANQLKLDQPIIDNGSNISSGQKQIILLLSLLAAKYDLILLDEALENISFQNIAFLKRAIKKFQDQAIWIEISNSKKFIHHNHEVDFAKINQA